MKLLSFLNMKSEPKPQTPALKTTTLKELAEKILQLPEEFLEREVVISNEHPTRGNIGVSGATLISSPNGKYILAPELVLGENIVVGREGYEGYTETKVAMLWETSEYASPE
jgi:hypothetical protein